MKALVKIVEIIGGNGPGVAAFRIVLIVLGAVASFTGTMIWSDFNDLRTSASSSAQSLAHLEGALPAAKARNDTQDNRLDRDDHQLSDHESRIRCLEAKTRCPP